jgi:protein-L-isoaspartate(D-aspartate) O-methyltransferase
MNSTAQRMLAEIGQEVAYTSRLTGRQRLDPRVMQAMGRVPREVFVPSDLQPYAYDNGPLPIGHGQTISQPYIVALMTDLLQLEPEHGVLEIGTGSGYQTAVLAELAGRVYTMELIAELGEASMLRLQGLNYTNIEYRTGNGYHGWPEHAPFDAIIVTAAAPGIPPALVEQLKPGGRLVLPVGQPYMHQELLLVRKDEQGESHTRGILGVSFVPLVGEPAAGAGDQWLHRDIDNAG